MSFLTSSIKRFCHSIGLRCLRERQLPRGLDAIVDLKEIGRFEDFLQIVDVGANIGQSVARFLTEFPNACVLACEPAHATFKELSLRYGGHDRVILANVALGEFSGTASMKILGGPCSEMNCMNDGSASNSTLRIEQVKMETLDELLSRLSLMSVDLLKIDTEGYELQVLEGGRRSFERGVIHAVLAECSFTPEDRQHSNFFPLYEYLDKAGMTFLGLYDVHHHLGRLHYCNALFVKQSEISSQPS